jgi:hypothetical protein
MAKTRFRITFTDGQTREYEDPITFDFPGTALKVFNGRELLTTVENQASRDG